LGSTGAWCAKRCRAAWHRAPVPGAIASAPGAGPAVHHAMWNRTVKRHANNGIRASDLRAPVRRASPAIGPISGTAGSGSTCGRGKRSWGCSAPRSLSRRVMIGGRGQVDWYEGAFDLAGERQVRRCGGAEYGRWARIIAPIARDAAGLSGRPPAAFHYFRRGVSAAALRQFEQRVKQILRVISARKQRAYRLSFALAFRGRVLHAGSGHEKGGVERGGGYFRRNHLVPIPKWPVGRAHELWWRACQAGRDGSFRNAC